MASNIEIKARIRGDVDAVHARAEAVADTGPTLIIQEDTFFVTTRGRLKLREFGGVGVSAWATAPSAGRGDVPSASSGATAELIYYERPDTEEPTASRYSLVAVPDPGALKEALAAAVGIRGVVRKRRTLYLAGETRIHIDEVDGLGAFLELEVVLPDGGRPEGDNGDRGVAQGQDSIPGRAATPDEGLARCRELMDALGVDERDLVDRAYIDLLEEADG